VLRAISRWACGRRSKWVVLSLWVLAGIALFQFQPKLQEATTNENEAFLPESAESTEVNDIVGDEFPDGREVDAIVLYTRGDQQLTRADFAQIESDARELCEPGTLEGVLAVIGPEGPIGCEAAIGTAQAPESAPPPGAPPAISEDRSTAVLLIRTNSEDSEEIQANVDAIRDATPPADAGDGELAAYTTGIAGIIADSIEVFESIDLVLLLVTVALVLVLLLAIYRSPVIALVPLFVVGIAYGIAAAAVYGLVEAGAIEVNGQTTALLIVLMFGAGTDYCLLIVSRYREELRQIEDKHEAMARATERTAPAILSAGATVIVSMLVLTLADFKATQTLGPSLALGIGVMLLAGLTFLPALLSCLGRNAFWPAIPRLGTEQRRPLNVWRRIGHFVHDHPMFAMLTCLVVLIAGSFGSLKDQGIIDFGEGFRDPPESVDGQAILEEKLSAGQTAATNVVVEADAAPAVQERLSRLDGVEAVVPSGESEDGSLVRLDATLGVDPFSDEANDLVPVIREEVRAAAGGATALVGGVSAENYDTAETLTDDARLIVPLVLGLILIILAILLRAIVAPLYLVATVVVSYAFALGASSLIFTEVFNQPDSDPGIPTFAFIFLVALGVDYNIFLISRIREEAAREETKEAVITGLERTGGVITSAGIILVGTFCALMALPLETLFQLGFTVAFGLLVDTFVVRTILVPAIAFQLGERNWWPSKISHGASTGSSSPSG
jgi:putative drug exporter of the RND superfamily